MDKTKVSGTFDSSSILLGATYLFNMFYAYVIKSVNHDFYYKGHCQNLDERLKQHNSGATSSIKSYVPFVIVYYEEFATKEEAIKREKYFKSAAGRRFLKTKVSGTFDTVLARLTLLMACPTDFASAGQAGDSGRSYYTNFHIKSL